MDRFEENKMKGMITPILILNALFPQTFSCPQNVKTVLNPFRFLGNVINDRVSMRKLNFTQFGMPAFFIWCPSNEKVF